MSNAYSIDLRERVVGYVAQGGSREEASRIFRVGIATVQRWMALWRKGESIAPKIRKPYKPRKISKAALKQLIAERPDATLAELGQALNVSAVAVMKACKRLNITRKKNNAVRRTKRRRQTNFSEGTGIRSS
jgi:putative transposase